MKTRRLVADLDRMPVPYGPGAPAWRRESGATYQPGKRPQRGPRTTMPRLCRVPITNAGLRTPCGRPVVTRGMCLTHLNARADQALANKKLQRRVKR